MFKKIFLLAVLLLASTAYAQEHSLGKLTVSQVWARATAPGASAGGGFLSIHNQGPADRLVAARAAVANLVELHTMRMDGNIMRMSRLEQGIELPAGKKVELRPGGLHIMFIELKAPLREGSRFPLELEFEKAGKLRVEVDVRSLGASSTMPHGH